MCPYVCIHRYIHIPASIAAPSPDAYNAPPEPEATFPEKEVVPVNVTVELTTKKPAPVHACVYIRSGVCVYTVMCQNIQPFSVWSSRQCTFLQVHVRILVYQCM